MRPSEPPPGLPPVDRRSPFEPQPQPPLSPSLQRAMDGPTEQVDHPAHYTAFGEVYEPIKVIEAWELGFCLGNAVKYVARAGRKSPDAITDLKKARWYLEREIANRESGEL